MATSGPILGAPMVLGLNPLSQSLPQLSQETELQKMLTDERMRSEQHRNNYEMLKTEHTRLQEECIQLHSELTMTVEESKIVQEKYKRLYEQCLNDLAENQAIMDDLKTKVVSPQRLEVIQLQISEEMEKPYREKFLKQEQEIDEHRNNFNKIRYELSFLKSEYEHQQQEHRSIVEEMKLQHEAEVSNSRKERESIITRIQAENSQDSQRVRVLQRENTQLHIKLKGLMEELEDIRARGEKSGLESDHVLRMQTKQLSEHASNVKALEAERESLRRQVESLQKEISSTGQLHNQLTGRIHELEKDNMMYRNKTEEVIHKGKVDLTNLKMEMLVQRGDLDRERDRLANEVDDIQAQLDIVKHTSIQQAQALVDKERDAVKRVQAAREEEFTKLTAVESEKLEMEAKLQEIERRKIDEEAAKHAEREKTEDRLKSAIDAKDIAEKELLVVKTKLTHHQSIIDQLERERSSNSELKSKVHRYETEISSIMGNEQQLTELNGKLHGLTEVLKEDLRHTKEQLGRAEDGNDKVLLQHRAAWVDEKTQLELRLHDLEEKQVQLHTKLNRAAFVQKRYKRKYRSVTESLKDKLQIVEAKNEQLRLEKQTLQKSVPLDEHNRLKKQTKSLWRRHNEFRSVIITRPDQVAIGDMSFASVTLPHNLTMQNFSFADQELQHQEDIRLLKERLDLLDDNQKHQLEELRDIGHSTLRLDDSQEKLDEEKYASAS